MGVGLYLFNAQKREHKNLEAFDRKTPQAWRLRGSFKHIYLPEQMSFLVV